MVRMFGLDPIWNPASGLRQTLRDGKPAADPRSLWEFFGSNAEANDIFNRAMLGKAQGQIAGILANYACCAPFSKPHPSPRGF